MESLKTTKSPEETFVFGKKILKKALKDADKDKPLTFCLSGELGAGKTYFVKGIASALGIKVITSPTFVVMKKFKISALREECEIAGKKYFFHIDCYRIDDAEDARQIDLDKIIANPRAIIAVEWAERIEEIIPKPYWKIEFKYKGEGGRQVTIDKLSD